MFLFSMTNGILVPQDYLAMFLHFPSTYLYYPILHTPIISNYSHSFQIVCPFPPTLNFQKIILSLHSQRI